MSATPRAPLHGVVFDILVGRWLGEARKASGALAAVHLAAL